jgi:signal transduction histidine kinase
VPGFSLDDVLVERWLRIIGLGTWLIAGSTSIPRVASAADPRAAIAWVCAFITFAVLFWIGSSRRAERNRRVACLLGQAVLAGALAWLGMPAFEGALFALVAAQVPLALPGWASIAWAVAQLPALWLVLPRDYNRIEIAKSLSAYIAFAAFAIAVVWLFESERRARVELARAGERVRIARELHDVLGHHLAALTIQLDLARRKSSGDARGPLDEAYGVAQRMLVDVRGTVSTLRTDDYDLRAALDAVVRAVPEPPITIAFEEGLDVDVACGQVALRCVQEAITNTVKHARAKKIQVALARKGTELSVTVEDDGAAAGDIRDGSGLRGMRERVEELGGALEIDSVARRGTIVRARLPMAARRAS